MGLDIALGIVVGLAALRGWFKGFLRQAIPLVGVVACVYAADPLRDLARPHAREYFPTIGHGVLDKILWWSSAALAYLVLTGIAFSVLKSVRKRTYGDPEPNRADQGAGFTLGVAKGLLLASVLASVVGRFGPDYYEKTPFVEEQAKESKALAWAERFKPAETLWASAPVQSFVGRVQSRGIWTPAEPADSAPPSKKEKKARAKSAETAEPSRSSATEPVRTASGGAKTLALPRRGLDPNSPDFVRELEDALRREGLDPGWR